MSWRDDVSPALAGDKEALARLREFLTPFAHGVALAWAPHHVVERLMPRILDDTLRTLAAVEPVAVGAYAQSVARRLAKEAAQAGIEEELPDDATVREARKTLARLRAVSDGARELFLLRVLEGVPGPEQAEVTGAPAAELRAELERGAAEAARALGQGQSFAGDGYLWDLGGAPAPFLAQLEMLLPPLRYDPGAPTLTAASASTAGTLQDLAPVGSSPRPSAPARGLLFDEQDETNVGTAAGLPPEVSAAPVAPVGANPFEGAARTIAAADLPAEARGSLPAPVPPIPSGSKSGLKSPLLVPPRGDGSAARGDESSGRSGRSEGSGKSGRLAPRDGSETSSKSGRMARLPPRTDLREDAAAGVALADADPGETRAQLPALVLKRQEEIVTSPEGHQGILNAPTAMQPALALPAETRIGVDPRFAARDLGPVAPPPRTLADELRAGATPFFIAGALLVVGLLVNWLNGLRTERQLQENWRLTSVVVAAEEMRAGTVITPDNVAQRAIPSESVGDSSDVVKAEGLLYILEQRLAVDVQMGDPLFYSQFIANRGNQRLSQRVAKQMRGYSIPAGALRAVGNHVKPGDVVDLVATFEMQGHNVPQNRGQHRAVTVLQAVTVLATGRVADFTPGAAVDEHEKPYDNVTLLLTAEEAEFVTLARTVGPLTLTLRNDEDREQFAQREHIDINTLLDGKRISAANRRQRQLVDIVKSIRRAPQK